MDLNKSLQNAGMTKWRRMARPHGLAHLEFAGNQLYQGLYKRLSNRLYLEEFYNGLSIDQKRVLKGVYLNQSCGVLFNTRYWDYYARYVLGSPTDLLSELSDTGLYFVNREQQGFLYQEMLDVMQKIYDSESQGLTIQVTTDVAMHSGGVQAVGEVVRFLALIVAQGLQLTKAGNIYKKDMGNLERIFGSDFSQKEFVRESRLGFIIKFVTNRSLVHNDEDVWKITEEGQLWLKNPASVMWRDLYHFWLTVHHRPTESHIGANLLTSIFRLASAQDYFIQDALRAWYEEALGRIPHVYDEEDWFTALVEEMVYLGILRRGEIDNKVFLAPNKPMLELIVDENIAFMTEDQFIMQPNFEILVSTHVRPEIIGRLAQLAEDRGGREMYRFVLTKSSLYRAHMNGDNYEDVMEFLRTTNNAAIPMNVGQAITDWFSQFGQLYFMETTLLCCRSAELAKQLVHNPRYEAYLIQQISDRILIVRDHQKFIKELAKNQYLPYEKLFTPLNVPFNYSDDMDDKEERNRYE